MSIIETTRPAVRIVQADRAALLGDYQARSFRKTARIVATRMTVPFEVETDRGIMQGVAGDWIVTNHPDDDSGSDIWSISAARMAATYQEVE